MGNPRFSGQSHRTRDRLVDVDNDAVGPAANLVAKEPEGADSDYILLLNFFDEIKHRAAQTTTQ